MVTAHPHKTTATDRTTVTVGQATFLVVAAIAEQHHTSVDDMAVELIQDGITARTTRNVRDHRCTPGEINTRFCRVCSRPINS